MNSGKTNDTLPLLYILKSLYSYLTIKFDCRKFATMASGVVLLICKNMQGEKQDFRNHKTSKEVYAYMDGD